MSLAFGRLSERYVFDLNNPLSSIIEEKDKSENNCIMMIE